MIDGREEVMQEVISKRGCHQKEAGTLLHISDSVQLVDTPIPAFWVRLVSRVVDERMMVCSD